MDGEARIARVTGIAGRKRGREEGDGEAGIAGSQRCREEADGEAGIAGSKK